ncbi:MAG: cytochrome c biogenesis protein CcsA [Phycisphaerae bacterium]
MNSMAFLYSGTGPVARLVRFLSSLWLCIFLLAAIILYSSVGSAVPPFRQSFELTEFAYFSHPLFVALVTLFCISLTVVTVVRIPLRVMNLGVLATHLGLLLLCGGSLLYFGRKIEGDVLLRNPLVQVISLARARGGQNGVIGQVVAAPGKVWSATMPMLGGAMRVAVKDVEHDGLRTAARVDLEVTAPGSSDARSLTLRQQGEQSIARINDQLILRLLPTNITDRFFDNNTAALLVRTGGQDALTFSLAGLPLYKERFDPAVEPILDTRGRTVRSEGMASLPFVDAWTMPLPVTRGPGIEIDESWPFTMEVDAYLPYADLASLPIPGGEVLDPVIDVSLSDAAHPSRQFLFARSPQRSAITTDAGTVEFRWLEAGQNLPDDCKRPIAGRQVLDVHVKDANVRKQFDLAAGGRFKVDGTSYELERVDVHPDWPLVTAGFEGARTPAARIRVRKGAQTFTRSVLQRFPQLNQDRDDAGKKLVERGLFDDNIELSYFDASAPHFLIAAGPDMAPVIVHTAPGGAREVRTLAVGSSQTFGATTLEIAALIEKPDLSTRPVCIPNENRRTGLYRQTSLIRLHLRDKAKQWDQRVWLAFENYNDQVVYADHAPSWVSANLPGAGRVEFLYGRMPRRLPGRVALEQMKVDFYPGRRQPSEWASTFRWEDPATGQIRSGRAFLNNTSRIGPWTFFQSMAAQDQESYTVLGVGNRDGVMAMLGGCVLASLGMLFAFYIKPLLKRRLRDRMMAQFSRDDNGEPAAQRGGRASAAVAGAILLAALALPGRAAAQAPSADPHGAHAAHADAAPPAHSAATESLKEFQSQLELDPLRLLIVQHGNRYQTLEAWARDVVSTIHGKPDFDGLDPVASALELMFNRAAYDARPIIYIKDIALRKNLTSHPVQLDPAEHRRIVSTGMVSAEFISRPDVQRIISELESNMLMSKAMNRFGAAFSYYQSVLSMLHVVPSPAGQADAPWHSIGSLRSNLGEPNDDDDPMDAAAGGVPGVSRELAFGVLTDFQALARGWIARDAQSVNGAIRSLSDRLPALAAPGVYPPLSHRRIESLYYRMSAFTWGWALYVASLFVSVWALIAGWNWTRRLALGFYSVAFLMHAAGLAMRWYIVGRVPVANMFEAVVSSAWLGAALALVLELTTRRRVYLLAGSFLGFLSLVLGKEVGSQITQIMPILDDIMLRIHTVLIISSYGIITLAFGVAVCYLAVAARSPQPDVARVTLGSVGGVGLCAILGYYDSFHLLMDSALSNFWTVILPVGFGAAGAALFVYLPRTLWPGVAGRLATLAPPGAAGIVSGRAGGAAAAALPADRTQLLEAFDLSHMILLHMATIALFVGLVLGAVWADYSWGRPWGWDPKEVFALVTWLFYAILIHVRLATRRRALWTAVLSCVGFAAMQFNWWVVNFYIVGLHSYA